MMDRHYARAAPPVCHYDDAGYCLRHPCAVRYAPAVPWCQHGRSEALAVARVYERQVGQLQARQAGASWGLTRVLWQRERAKLSQAAAQLRRAAG